MLYSFAIVGILLIVALVIDLSFVRNTRQTSKSTADAAVAAGLQSLVTEGIPRPWSAACTSLAYLKANAPDASFSVDYWDGDGSPVSGDPCSTRLDDECDPLGNAAGDRSSWAFIEARDGSSTVHIRSGYETPDPSFPEDFDAYLADQPDPLQGFCDQLAVIVSESDDAYFGGIAGRSSYETAIRTVGRVQIEQGDGVPAFLMLERIKCEVLVRSNFVGAGDGIIVEPAADGSPGIIHTDSKGSSGCTGGPEESHTVYSAAIGSTPGIWAKDGTTADGILSLQAILAGNSATAYATADGVKPEGRGGAIVSRKPVDTKYQPEVTIAQIHATGYLDSNRTDPPIGYDEIGCDDNSGTFDGLTRIFINCPTGYQPDQVTFTDATDVIFNGPVQVSGSGPTGRHLFMPEARWVVIGGDGSRGLDVDGGRLAVNATAFTDTDEGVDAACDGRENPPPDRPTQLVIFGGGSSGSGAGALNVAGRAALCQTSVYLAGPNEAENASYEYSEVVTTNAYDVSCSISKPCPRDGVAPNAHFDISGYVRWTAPDQLSTTPSPGAVGVEDLALWTESSTKSEVKSGGRMRVNGVLFFPNADVEMRSPAVATPQDAQFIGRRLKLFAGTLRMRPTAENSVPAPFLASLGLVR